MDAGTKPAIEPHTAAIEARYQRETYDEKLWNVIEPQIETRSLLA